jgi:hypothetical protein
VSGNDLLQYWEEDSDTDVVLLHLETIGNARKFARLVHRVSRTKPVLMVRMGGAQQRHPLGHAVTPTSLPQRAVDQILADCGLVVVQDVDQMIGVSRALLSQPLPLSDRVAVIGNSDALAALAENALIARGLTPFQPVETFARAADPDAYRAAVYDASHQPGVGAVLVIHVPPIEQESDATLRERLRSCAGCGSEQHAPVVAVMAPGPPGDVPTFVDVEEAAEALAVVRDVARWRDADAQRSAALDPTWEAEPVPTPAGPVVDGDAAAELLCRTGGCGIVVDSDAAGDTGCRIDLVDDPLYGMVVSVGLDDRAADLLGDRSYRLAPVSRATALHMLTSLATAPLLTPDGGDTAALHRLATAVSDLSHLHQRAPGVRGALLRQARVNEDGDVAAGVITVMVGDPVSTSAPTARRL